MECPVCGNPLRLEPSTFPSHDAPCPCCGCLVWLASPDVATCRPTEESLSEVLQRLAKSSHAHPSTTLRLDFREIEHLTGPVVRWLVKAAVQTSATGRQLELCHVCPDIREVFQITRLDRLFEIKD